MPIHPQTQQVLEWLEARGLVLGGDFSVLRERFANLPQSTGEAVSSVENRTIQVGGVSIPLRIYRPVNASGVLSALTWFHSGGWVVGNLDMTDGTCRMLANASGAVVVSVGYRLAPEHKFPAAPDDCFAATKWVFDHAAELSVDRAWLAVGGESAGGNLAAVVTQMARDAGDSQIKFQLLVTPVTNHCFSTVSYQENAQGYLLTRASMEWFWGHYLRNKYDGDQPRASPLRAPSFAGLPPALIVTAEYDPLRDEGEPYAQSLREFGVTVELQRYNGQIHGFFGNPIIDDGIGAVLAAGNVLRAALAATKSVTH